MQLTIPHQFTREEAKARIVKALNEARGKLEGQVTIDREEWAADTLTFGFTVQKQTITGTFEVRDHDFVLDAKLPLMLKMFEGRIEAAIKEQAGQLLK